jgi:hypothetical protein
MKPRGLLLLLVGGTLVLACALGTQPPLISRGLPREDRYAFATQNGYDVEPEVRNAFISGCLVKGMRRDFAFQLYGMPDRTGILRICVGVFGTLIGSVGGFILGPEASSGHCFDSAVLAA